MSVIDFEQRFKQAMDGLDLSLSDDDEPTEEIETLHDDEKVAEAVRPPTPINLFQHPDAHPIALDLALLRKYGPEWFDWEHETVEWRIPQDFKTTSISDLNMNKILAIKTLHVIQTPWTNWEVFNWVVAPLNGMFPDFDILQVPTYAQCMVAVDIAARVRTDVPWSEEVQLFIETVARHDGIFVMIEPLDFVALDASNTIVDTATIKERWSSVRRSGDAPTADTVEDEQLRRLLDAHDYLRDNREQLRRQLPQVLDA